MGKDFNFVDEHAVNRPTGRPTGPGGLIGFLMRKGIAKTPGQANLYLTIILVICIGLIIYLNFF